MGQVIEDIETRYLIRRDMESVLEIENASFPEPWSEIDFRDCLRSRTVFGMVANRDEKVVGFMVIELVKGALHVLNMAVHSSHRHTRVGSCLLSQLFKRLGEKRPDILIDCRESRTDVHLFLKWNDFTCYGIKKEFYDNGETAYRFRYNLFGLDE